MRFFHSVRPDNDRTLTDHIQSSSERSTITPYPSISLITSSLWIIGPYDINLSTLCIYLLIYRVNRPLYSETKSGSLCFYHFHCIFLSLITEAAYFTYHFINLISELSTKIASFCFSTCNFSCHVTFISFLDIPCNLVKVT